MLLHILQDALFAAIAAIGFAAISRPPRRAFIFYGVIAAIGHSLRFYLMDTEIGPGLHIICASLIASFIVGVLSVFFSPLARTPAETCLFPALLPMIPGIYAYKSFGGLAMCLLENTPDSFNYYFYQFSFNGLSCLCILLNLAIGATLPIFIFGKISFQATRYRHIL